MIEQEEKIVIVRKRGFAAMSVAKRREIAKKGGQVSHQRGTAHEFTPEEAKIAGRKGGKSKKMQS